MEYLNLKKTLLNNKSQRRDGKEILRNLLEIRVNKKKKKNKSNNNKNV